MKRLIGVAVSLLLLAVIWSRIDPAGVRQAMLRSDPLWFWTAVLVTVPLTTATAWRFRLLANGAVDAAYALRLVLAASTLNLILPSKLGDLAKAWALRSRGVIAGPEAVALVVLEKLLDLLSLLLVGGAALALDRPEVPGLPLIVAVLVLGGAGLLAATLPAVAAVAARAVPGRLAAWAQAWAAGARLFWGRPGRALGIVAGSLLLWAGHLLQLWLFARAMGPSIPYLAAAALSCLAILAGLLPFTFAGVGTRDAAIVILFQPYLSAPEAALLGLCATLRYLLPALAGLPFVGEFWARAAPAR
jgi:uncharacterized membrane protein YbhN (UPF0104 family)